MSTNAQAVLLLAGEGTRLRPHTLDRPKCLVEVGGRPLLDRALASIEAAGIPGVVLVTGYRSEMIDAFLAARASKATVVTVKNEAYASTNNAYSLACARKAVDRPFLLLDGDLLFEPAVMSRLLASHGEAVLAVEKRKTLGAEEMKVILDERGTIAAVNKEVDPGAAIGEAIGIARFGTSMIDKLFDRLEAQIAEGRRNIFYEKAFEELIAAGEAFHVADVSGLACMEIDTPEDLEAARTLAQRIQALPARLAAPMKKTNLKLVKSSSTAPTAGKKKSDDGRLAIDGGTPVRATALPGPYPGALLMGKEEERQVLEVLRSKSLFRYYGPDVLGKAAELERRLAARVGAKHALAVNSGTSALKCALFALGVGVGDEVLVPAHSYVATADVVLSLGARPVFVEIDETMTMSPVDLKKKIHKKVRAVCVVHLFGVAADMDAILAITKPLGIPVLEDCAQSLGAAYRGKTVGQIGDIGVYSFQLNKVITAGEGGAITTNDARLHDRAVRLHDHGNHRGNESAGVPQIGEGFRMGELTAAVLLAQLGRLDDILSRLRSAKRTLSEGLEGVPGVTLTPVPDPEGDAGVALTYLCDTEERATRAVAALNAENIRVLRQYGGKPIYQQAAVKSVKLTPEPLCPRTADLVGRCVFLGLTTTFSKRDLGDVVAGVRKVMGRI